MENKPFQKLKYKIGDIPHGTDLLHKFPDLAAIKEFSSYGNPDRNKIIRYIIYCYDPGSDFIEIHPNLSQRKEASLIEAGFERNKKDEFSENLQDIMNLQNDQVTDMIFAYLVHLNNRTWMMLVSTTEMFLEYQRLIIRPISSTPKKVEGDDDEDSYYFKEKEKDILSAADMKKKLREECNAMDADIDRYQQKIFGDNEDLKEAIVAKKRITPESIANKKG